ncbi:DNA mismatch repair protein MutS [candidate division WOR-1 bacterium RIFOXYA12_FULL_43_27]|uniref:DNA mismatch repair protein MutS n=1 Tax=candidate division WOR-1 bacterium RIFOXYC2_FULL_46_14 TaxID=1802587 RepID=A0A1F4U3U9_UNCSA|nr:MAG: DNA mismatch repair protein MutS [candidate division WOR-1 bacterium RIFOXYA12_FULL_43_27]OGC20102.1 MAG: DNA mismatch repair protein MutS [candidate division WOR-1 bacterium RIFOXYB2_FULL_46_45]OGC32161.1 MAG: DNA mismatch repair protein MutS [candidate division WOR-1 bacterium RIFOXYA2_FULL_46_56]OGC39561.1 MAG: DNA mismatch repair protein MutS [candidate division WOR-1 bacterium RIFOXYC2_FULL_46_14]
MSEPTPMVAQYHEIKSKHRDAILFFRLGDFYEMFYDDAVLASRELELTLTGRGKDENRMPMCGIPYHAASNYIQKLIEKGYKIAICEQIEDPALAKGLVKREVIKIYTPGTIIESSMLYEKSNNYLMAIAFDKGKYGIAYADASTGEFKITQVDSEQKVKEEIDRINPSELLVSDMIQNFVKAGFKPASTFVDKYDSESASERIKEHFQINNLESFGVTDFPVGLQAAAAILDYLSDTQKTPLDHINKINPYRVGDFMLIDSSTRRNLELVKTIRDKSFKGSLLWVLDQTKTPMGSRLLRSWILQPLLNTEKIQNRLDAVLELFNSVILREELGKQLKAISDVERLTAKVAAKSCNARDLIALSESLRKLPAIVEVLKNCKAELLEMDIDIESVRHLSAFIQGSLIDDPPIQITEGGIIRSGYNAELDEIKKATTEGKAWIAELEVKERQRTGIKSLKVSFNRVFGYYIDITKSNLDQVPSDYIRKQTLVNSERYITPELKDREALILNADDRMKKLEYEIFCQIREEVAKHTKSLQQTAHILAQLDVLLSLAEVAVANNYCKPVVRSSDHQIIRLSESRHPVVEKMLGEHRFVPNDVELSDEISFLLITGPNMGGKSTYMRQVALICLMAQIGSFVPAKEAEVGLVDRVFTRIGAMDDIFSGQSTFMLEMTETANILNNATEKSLIILDEIGRGTATFDGMSIAAAVAEYIHTKIKAKTMFATHYHEICAMAEKHPGMKNLNVAVLDEKDHVTFLHKIMEGPADKSYGIQVAKLAGLPHEVIDRAKEIMVEYMSNAR